MKTIKEAAESAASEINEKFDVTEGGTRQFERFVPSPEMADVIARHFSDYAALRDAAERAKKLEQAIRWALGETGSFPPREDGQGKYWWRTELRSRAGLNTQPTKET